MRIRRHPFILDSPWWGARAIKDPLGWGTQWQWGHLHFISFIRGWHDLAKRAIYWLVHNLNDSLVTLKSLVSHFIHKWHPILRILTHTPPPPLRSMGVLVCAIIVCHTPCGNNCWTRVPTLSISHITHPNNLNHPIYVLVGLHFFVRGILDSLNFIINLTTMSSLCRLYFCCIPYTHQTMFAIPYQWEAW